MVVIQMGYGSANSVSVLLGPRSGSLEDKLHPAVNPPGSLIDQSQVDID